VTENHPELPLVPTQLAGDVTKREVVNHSVAAAYVHYAAVQAWMNRRFLVREGYPVPVILASPMNAFSEFIQLMGAQDGPFKYLFALKDTEGQPVYQPRQGVAQLPLISVQMNGITHRTAMNYGIHDWRRVDHPTVSDNATRQDLGNATQAKMPAGWNYNYNVEHYCRRPDTQMIFMHELQRAVHRASAGSAQTWITVNYPGWWGAQKCRLYIGNPENLTEPDEQGVVIYRTSFSVTVEGWFCDLDLRVLPTFWTLVTGSRGTLSPRLAAQLVNPESAEDLRAGERNPNLNFGQADLPVDPRA
jgi:hypothetical protein